VTALQRKGFVEVRGDAGDRRRTLVVTERARRYWAGRDDGDVAAVRGWFAALDGPELATLTDLATKVLAHAASQRPPHPPSRRPPHRPSVPDTPDGGAGT
jgi:DNA-binding MarR family transcriptional regulator